jgi:hypothetical protein
MASNPLAYHAFEVTQLTAIWTENPFFRRRANRRDGHRVAAPLRARCGWVHFLAPRFIGTSVEAAHRRR